MPIETLDDVIEEIANQIDRYGAHEGEERESCRCRMCFTTGLADRIRRAVRVEGLLREMEENHGPNQQGD